MKRRIIMVMMVVITIVVGTITTGKIAYADDPPPQNPGEPFAAIIGLLEAIQLQITDANNAILGAISALSNDVANVQSDILMIQSDLAQIKANTDDVETDLQTLSGKIDNIPEPLYKFAHKALGVTSGISQTLTVDSTGVMVIEICKNEDGVVWVYEENVRILEMETNNGPICSSVGIQPTNLVEITANPQLDEETVVDVFIRTTTSATLNTSIM